MGVTTTHIKQLQSNVTTFLAHDRGELLPAVMITEVNMGAPCACHMGLAKLLLSGGYRVNARREAANTAGRDFAIGYIHGHFTRIQAGLNAANLNRRLIACSLSAFWSTHH